MAAVDLLSLFAPLTRLDIYEKRQINSEGLDIVFENRHAQAWHEKLTEIFGPPLKAPGAKPTAEAKRLTRDCGGIRPEQSLYLKTQTNHHVIVVCWPWQNNRYTTVKLFATPIIPASPKKKWWFF